MDIFDDAGNPVSNAALIALIVQYRKTLTELSGGSGVSVIAGENRRVEFTQGNETQIQAWLRDCLTVARRRGLAIGGDVGALTVEAGHRV